MRDLMDELERDIDWWTGTGKDAQAGDTIVGTIEAITEVVGDYGPYPVVEVLTDGGELVNISCARSVLRNEIEKNAPRPGDRIGVRYVGPATSSKGSEYQKYRVRIDRQAPAAGGPVGEDVAREVHAAAQATPDRVKTSPTSDELAAPAAGEIF